MAVSTAVAGDLPPETPIAISTKVSKPLWELGLNLGVDSEDVDLRDGMDDTATLFEIGPSLKIMLARTASSEWRLSLPLRVNVAINSEGAEESGYTFAPEIQYSRRFNWTDRPWVGTASAGIGFGTRDFQNNYYGVASGSPLRLVLPTKRLAASRTRG